MRRLRLAAARLRPVPAEAFASAQMTGRAVCRYADECEEGEESCETQVANGGMPFILGPRVCAAADNSPCYSRGI